MRWILLFFLVLLQACSETEKTGNPLAVEMSASKGKGAVATSLQATYQATPIDSNYRQSQLWYFGDELAFTVYRHDTHEYVGGHASLKTDVDESGYAHSILFEGPRPFKMNNYMGRFSLDAMQGINASSGYFVDGIQVLGPRLAAIENATSPEDAVVKLNLLLAAMRQHGLIDK